LYFILHSNIFLAAAALILTISAQIQLGLKPYWNNYLCLIFFATLFEYNLHRINKMRFAGRAKNTEKYKWHVKNKKLVFLLLYASLTGFIATAFTNELKFLLALLPFGLLSFFYSSPDFKQKKSSFFFRKVPFLKIFILAFVWSASTIVLPVINNNIRILNREVLWLFTERFFFIFAIIIPFDIRDMEEDRALGLKTFPLLMEPKNALKISYLLLAFSILILFFHYDIPNQLYIVMALLISTIVTIILLSSAYLKSRETLYYHLIDGTLILQGSLVLVFYILN